MRNIIISRGRARKPGAEVGLGVAVLEITATGVAEVDVTSVDVAWIAVGETDSVGAGVVCIGIKVTLLSNEPFDRLNVSSWD